jgi:DNA-binding SARP family transcriptional activator
VRLSILGALEVSEDDRVFDLGGGKQRAVLAILLLRTGEIVSVDALIDALWGVQPPDKAENTIQVYVSRLRKAVGERLVTRKPGYILNVLEEDDFDARTFARAVEQARGTSDVAEAARLLREADALWRGAPLADFAFEPWAQREIDRLNEVRLTAIEERFDAELLLGRGGELVPELETLVAQHPLRERLRAQLMTSLYRAGRQADALGVYQDARRALTDELGIDPSPALQQLERDILAQDGSLVQSTAPAKGANLEPPATDVSIVIAPRDPSCSGALLALAEPLARSEPPHELILCRLIGAWSSGDLREATRALRDDTVDLQRRGVAARAIAFNSNEPAVDFARLASENPVDLLLFDAEPDMFEAGDARSLAPILAAVGCDVAAVIGAARATKAGAPIIVPFGGADHDWSALQFGAWLAKINGAPLHLLGSVGDAATGARDASRLLANASLVVQRMTRVVAEPILVEPVAGVLRAIDSAGAVVIGLSERWRTEGLGPFRAQIAEAARAPVVLLRRGEASTGLSAQADQTRYAWSRVARD